MGHGLLKDMMEWNFAAQQSGSLCICRARFVCHDEAN
jgi:hypothetical protein